MKHYRLSEKIMVWTKFSLNVWSNVKYEKPNMQILLKYVLKKIVIISEIIKVGVVTIDVLSIGIKFENFMQAGYWDLASHRGRTLYC